MRIIRLIFISFIFFFLLITGISFFIPSHIRISKAIDIRTSKETVHAQLADPRNWKNWYPGADKSGLLIQNDSVNGIITNAEQKLMITSVSDTTVLTELTGPGQRKAASGWNILMAAENRVTIQWYIDFHLRWYPWEKFSSLMFEPRYGPWMEQGLQKLKKILEN